MPLQLRYLESSEDLAPGCDLSRFLSSAETKILSFSQSLLGIGPALADAPAGKIELPFACPQLVKWDLGRQGNVCFSFAPSFQGAVQIQKSGELFSYNLGEDEVHKVTAAVPEGMAYVSVSFNVALGVSAGPAFSSGNFGVSGHIDSRSTFSVVYRKAFPGSTTIPSAIRQAFESFVLPFQPDGVARLQDHDYLDYEFFGSIGAGFGISYGVSGTLLSGRSMQEIERSLKFDNIGSKLASSLPAYSAGASFAVEYQHTDTFRVIIERQLNTSANAVVMAIMRKHSKVVSAAETVGITAVRSSSPDLVSSLQASAHKLAESALVTLVADPVKQECTKKLAAALDPAGHSPLQRYLEDAANVIEDFIRKPENQQAQLALKQERVEENTALFNFAFDLNQPEALAQGYALAAQGNLAEAVKVRGVVLNPGSYLEDCFIRRTAVTLQIFDLFTASNMVDYFDRVTATYAGHGIFRLMLKTGVQQSVTVHGKTNSCEVYFTAEPPAGAQDLVVKLNFTIIDHTQDSARQTVRVLQSLHGTALDAALAEVPSPFMGELKTTCQFAKENFAQIACDQFVNGRPGPLPHLVDAANYEAFVAAVNAVLPLDRSRQSFLSSFGAYDAWVEFNRVKVDREGSVRIPDRKNSGNAVVSVWPQSRIGLPTSERLSVQCYVYAAQHYMNLCDSLQHLAGDMNADAFEEHFALLKSSLDRIIHQDIDVYFTKPTLVALFGSTGGSVGHVRSQLLAKRLDISFDAEMKNSRRPKASGSSV